MLATRSLCSLVGLVLLVGVVLCGPAPLTRPPRGWSSRGVFDCTVDCSRGMDTCLSEVLMRNMADVLAQPEFSKAGYNWLLLGNCWSDDIRDPHGNLLANDTRFPGGIQAVADYAHKKGLYLSLYVTVAAAGSPGMPTLHGHIVNDVRTLTSWGVDMIYVDTDMATYPEVNMDFHELGQAIRTSGSDLRVACTWPQFLIHHGIKPNYDEIKHICDVYQSTETMTTSSGWDDVKSVANYYASDTHHVTQASGTRGKWNDMGMLLMGEGNLNLKQWQAQMAIWAMYDSAMFVSCDLPSMPTEVKRAMLLPGVLDIDGDTLDQKPGHLVQNEHLHIWHRYVSYGDYVILLLNTSPNVTTTFSESLAHVGLSIYPAYHVRDVINDVDYGQVYVTDAMRVTVWPSSAIMLRCFAQH